MSTIVASAGIKAAEKINWNRMLAVTGVIVLVIALAVIVKKYIKKSKNEAAADAYLQGLKGDISSSELSYSYPSWYEAQSISLAAALDASFGNNGGLFGCDQKAVYAIVEQLKTKADAMQLEESFGTRELNASWIKKKKPMTLREAMQNLMTTKEHKKVNEILKENGIDYSY